MTYILRKFLSFVLLIFVSWVSTGTTPDSTTISVKLDSLKNKFPNVEYAGRFQVSFYHALSAFPQLTDAKIEFVERRIKTTMQCRPKPLAIFRSKLKRKYLMVHNRDVIPKHGMPMHRLSYDARVGLYAHEIAHVLDYTRMSILEVIRMGLSYLTAAGKQTVEHRIDRMVVWMGMGPSLLRFASEVSDCECISNSYKIRRDRFYMKPADIKQLIRIVENKVENVQR